MLWYRYNTSRQVEGKTIPGVYLPAVVHNIEYFFQMIGVYQDNMIECWELCSFDHFVDQMVKTGWVTNTVPEGQTLIIHDHKFASVRVAQWDAAGTMEDLVKDVRSALDELNGRHAAQTRLLDALIAYRKAATEGNLNAIQAAFNQMPSYYLERTSSIHSVYPQWR